MTDRARAHMTLKAPRDSGAARGRRQPNRGSAPTEVKKKKDKQRDAWRRN